MQQLEPDQGRVQQGYLLPLQNLGAFYPGPKRACLAEKQSYPCHSETGAPLKQGLPVQSLHFALFELGQ